jgi:hypothetical protein
MATNPSGNDHFQELALLNPFASAMGKNVALSVPACKGFFLTSIDYAL